MENLSVTEQIEYVIENLEYQTSELNKHGEMLKISIEKIAKGNAMLTQAENLFREGKTLLEKGESELQTLIKNFIQAEEISDMIGHLNDQVKEVVSLEITMADMELDDDVSSKGKLSSLKEPEASCSSTSTLVKREQIKNLVPSTMKKELTANPQRIVLNPSSREIKVLDISPLERYVFEKIKMIYEIKQNEFCYPDHTGVYPRINLLPGADPELFKDIYEMGFLGTVYPSYDFRELKLIPDLFKDLKQLKRDNVFLKFFQISPEYQKGFGIFETYSVIEVGYLSENFNFVYDQNQPWKKSPNINREFTKYRRALGFKTVSSIIKNYLKTFYVLKMKPEFALLGRNGGIRGAEQELEKISNQMVNHEFIGSMETAERLCKLMKHADCSQVLGRLQKVLDECCKDGEECNPFVNGPKTSSGP